MNHQISSVEMKNCFENCQQCHVICLQTAMNHCLEAGEAHVEPAHMRLMLNCAEICQTTANFMISNSSVSSAVCQACAVVCTACADSCEEVGEMSECVEACRRCAESCEKMSKMA